MFQRLGTWSVRWLAVTFIAVAASVPTLALACGGCFSPVPAGGGSAGPPTVKQVGERVLFVSDPASGLTRVWIEIRYNGPADAFAWVLPLPKVPKVGVGDSWLFDRLDLATMPRFEVVQDSDENCDVWTKPQPTASGGQSSTSGTTRRQPPRQDSQTYAVDGGCGGGLATSGAGYSVTGQESYTAGDTTSGPPSNPSSASSDGGSYGNQNDNSELRRSPQVELKAHAQTGPYDYVVIDSKDPTALTNWLNSNGYTVPKQAGPIIAAHVAKGDVFLAVRLANPAGVQEIMPITLEMKDADPCVPLRLTSIAAVEDTSVVVFLAGPGRALPKNTPHVVPNPVLFDWLAGAGNYQQVLSAAIDQAGGHAFATEFAGPVKDLYVPSSNELARRKLAYGDEFGLYDSGPALTLPRSATSELADVTNLYDLANFLVQYHVPIEAKTVAVLEPAVGLAAKLGRSDDAVAAYQELLSGTLMLTTSVFEWPVKGPALVPGLSAYLPPPPAIAPGLEAIISAIQQQKTMTRLALFISPEEMDRDPQFAFDPKLPAVTNEHAVGANHACTDGWYPSNAIRLTVPGLGSWVTAGKKLATDLRFSNAPALLRVEVLDEVKGAQPISLTQIELVDAALLGAKPGLPSLPANLVLAPAPDWKPPASDPQLWQKLYGSGLLMLRSPAARMVALLVLLAAVVLRRRQPLLAPRPSVDRGGSSGER